MARELEEQLLKIGITKSEAKVYLTLLKFGALPAGTIAQKSHVHRSNVYDALVNLIKKGLVNYIYKEKRKYFEACNPEKITQVMEHQLQEFKQVIPELQVTQRLIEHENTAHLVEGVAGLRQALLDEVKHSKEVLFMGLSEDYLNALENTLVLVNRERKKRKIKARFIADQSLKDEVKLWNKEAYTQAKQTKAQSKCLTILTKRAVIIVLRPAPLVAVVIESEDLVLTYKNYFEVLWK